MAKPAEFAAPLGEPPSIEFKRVSDLWIDAQYQRDATAGASQSLIRSIASGWDWRLYAPLVVSRRLGADGGPSRFFVIDGQHRLEAARMRGDIDYLPCIVSTFDTIEDEARLFVQVNTRRKPPGHLDTFRARLAASDEGALQIARLIAEAGMTIATHTNHASWRARQFGALGGVKTAIARYGEAVAARALADIASAFPQEPLRSAGTILIGLYAIHGKPPAGFDPSRLRRVLGLRDQSEWMRAMIQRQAKHGEIVESAITWALLDAYNAGGAA